MNVSATKCASMLVETHANAQEAERHGYWLLSLMCANWHQGEWGNPNLSSWHEEPKASLRTLLAVLPEDAHDEREAIAWAYSLWSGDTIEALTAPSEAAA